MVHFTNFRPFHRYQSYYPYYLPSYYSSFYPGRYHRYFHPTSYWLEKRQPIVDLEPKNAQVERKKHSWFNLTLLIVLAYIIFVTLKR